MDVLPRHADTRHVRHGGERLAAVAAPLERRVDGPDRVRAPRVDEDLGVVGRTAAGVARELLPRRALIVRPVEAFLGVHAADDREHALGRPRIGRERDAADVVLRQVVRQLGPRLAAVLALEDAAVRPAADHLPDVAPALVRARVHDVRALRIERHVGDARVLVDRERGGPRLAAVGRLVEAALAAFREERPLCGDPDDVRIAGIDDDAADVLGRLEADARPRLARVRGLVDAVAEVRAALARVFARAEPEDVRVPGIDDDAAQRERSVVLEDRLERDAAVHGLPHAAECRRDVPDARVLRVDRDVLDPARVNRRADVPELERLERVDRQRAGVAGALTCSHTHGRNHDRRTDNADNSLHGRQYYRSRSPAPYSPRAARLLRLPGR